MMPKLQIHKPSHTTNLQENAAIQPSWWDAETQAARTDKPAVVIVWPIMEEKTELLTHPTRMYSYADIAIGLLACRPQQMHVVS